MQVLARAQQVPLQAVRATIRGVLDPNKPVRPDVTLFNAVQLHFSLKGVRIRRFERKDVIRNCYRLPFAQPTRVQAS